MKTVLVLAALATIPLIVGAQQPENGKPFDWPEVDHHCMDDAHKMFRDLCLKWESEAKEDRRKFIENQAQQAIKAANDAKEAAENAAKIGSHDTGTQIDGATGLAKDMNSHANSNSVSKEVTGKSLSLIDQFAQRENELLIQTRDKVQTIGTQVGSPSSSFNSGEQHQLVERPSLTLDQQFEQRAGVLLSAPRELQPTRIAPITQHPSLDQEFESREGKLLSFPSTVQAIANGVRTVEAADQARREREAREEAARLAAINAEKERAAEAKRMEEKRKADVIDAELKAFERQERIEAARERAAQQALWNAMYGPPVQPAYYPIAPTSFDSSSFYPSTSSYDPSASSGSTTPSKSSATSGSTSCLPGAKVCR